MAHSFQLKFHSGTGLLVYFEVSWVSFNYRDLLKHSIFWLAVRGVSTDLRNSQSWRKWMTDPQIGAREIPAFLINFILHEASKNEYCLICSWSQRRPEIRRIKSRFRRSCWRCHHASVDLLSKSLCKSSMQQMGAWMLWAGRQVALSFTKGFTK